jgi:Ca2+/H+ antiporter
MCDTSLYWFLMFVCVGGHGTVHWSRLRALSVLIMATLLMAACADLTTEHIKPILDHSSISQVRPHLSHVH